MERYFCKASRHLSTSVIVNGTVRKGPSGSSVLVLETSCNDTRLEDRKIVHRRVLEMLPQLWQTANLSIR